jgi:tripartite-type tricarboxylate transporter receptor subunit TctC
VVDKLNAEIGKITANPEVRKAWGAQGATAMSMGVAEFGRYLNDDIAKWANVVKVSGAKVD